MLWICKFVLQIIYNKPIILTYLCHYSSSLEKRWPFSLIIHPMGLGGLGGGWWGQSEPGKFWHSAGGTYLGGLDVKVFHSRKIYRRRGWSEQVYHLIIKVIVNVKWQIFLAQCSNIVWARRVEKLVYIYFGVIVNEDKSSYHLLPIWAC